MIAVIADDFTGAAEIGGVGIRHGFDVIIETQVFKNIDTDILIIATDTRSQGHEEAQILIEKITTELLTLQPDFIYKKVDSTLRGNVGEELMAQLRASHKERALLVPAYPALKRTIKDGIYYYDGVPLEEFNFSNGHMDKRTSSKVLDLIGEKARPFVTIVSTENVLPEKGLIIGSTVNADDMANWVQRISPDMIPAGGASFFDAILQVRGARSKRNKAMPFLFGKKVIYVCGSAFVPSRNVVQNAKASGQLVVTMPGRIFCDGEQGAILLDQWADEIVQGIEQADRVIVAVDEIDCSVANVSLRIREAVANVIEKVMKEIEIDELVVEGGATAYSIIKKLKYTRFCPTQELAPGVTRMKVEENKNLFLTLKPGSYRWPASIWQS